MLFYEPGTRDRQLPARDPSKALAALRPIARCGSWCDYTVVEHIFRMRRPTE